MNPPASIEHPIRNPFLDWLGAQVTAWRKDYAEITLLTHPNQANWSGHLHGGVICTLLDAAAGYCGVYAPPDALPIRSCTLSLTTNFVSTGQGERLTAKGYVERQGRSIYFSRSELWLDETQLLATAVGTFKYLTPSAAR